MKKVNYAAKPLSFNRKAVIASATVTSRKNSIHCLTDVDISVPRQYIKEYQKNHGEKLSLTAYITKCLAESIREFPQFNSFIKGNKLIVLDGLTISVLVERELHGEKTPEPVGIRTAQDKSYREIHNEIREAQSRKDSYLGSYSGMSLIRYIPGFLMRMFVRIAERNIKMADKYGKVCVTAVGMYNMDAIWFIPHGSATILVTIGGIDRKVVETGDGFQLREHLCLTVSFDHNIVDGPPAARFIKHFSDTIRSAEIIREIL
jgi:pyruvate/2-oxoglutarate dehydrogenase complex dihydrolipoamide acyltransferase (E2) component